MDREVERRKPPDGLRVVRITPKHRAHAAALEQRAEGAVDVRSRRLLFDERGAGSVDGSVTGGRTASFGWHAELGEEHVGSAA